MSYPVYLPFGQAIDDELDRARAHGEFNSLHEAYAVLLEEVDELWDIARQKKRDRDPEHIKKELIQIAAMAIKALQNLEKFHGGSI